VPLPWTLAQHSKPIPGAGVLWVVAVKAGVQGMHVDVVGGNGVLVRETPFVGINVVGMLTTVIELMGTVGGVDNVQSLTSFVSKIVVVGMCRNVSSIVVMLIISHLCSTMSSLDEKALEARN